MSDYYLNIPDSGSPQWKAPVGNAGLLPSSGNNNGDVRVAQDTDTIYVWNGTMWVAVATPGASIAIDALLGDVSATGPGAVAATVNFVGGVSAANVALGANAANAATPLDTPNTIVERDGSGNFAAGTITSTGLIDSGLANNTALISNGSNQIISSITTSTELGYVSGVTSSIQTQLNSKSSSSLPNADIYVGNASNIASAVPVSGDLSLINTGAFTVNSVGGSSSANIHAAELAANAATNLNTPSTIVKRDSSGNFSAGTITAALIGNVTGNVSGSSASFTGSLSGDVTGTQTTTSISSPIVTGKLLTGYVTGTNTPILATDTILVAFEKLQAQASSSSGSAITALTGDGTATGPGSVPFTLATVNANIGTFGSSTSIPTFTVNGKGLITSASSNVVIAPAGTLTGTTLASNVVSSSLTSVGTLSSLAIATPLPISSGGTGSNTQNFVDLTTNQTVGGNKTFTGQTAVSNTSTTAFTVNTNTLVVDATNGAIGINTTPATTAVLDVVNNSGSTKAIQVTGYGSNVGFRGRQANGTLSSPTQTLSGNTLSFFSGRGYGTSQFAAASTGVINIVAAENFTNTSNATYLAFSTTPTGSVTSTERMRINSTGNILMDQITDNGVDVLQIGSGLISSYSKLAGATSGYVQQSAPSIVSTYGLVWPSAQSSAGQYLLNDGAGNLSWTNAVSNIDGGNPSSNYTVGQVIIGGTP